MDRGQPKNTRRMRRALRAPLLAVLLVLVSAAAAQASTIVVNTPADAAPNADECSGNPGTTDCSLRQAVDKAASGDTIQLPAGLYGVTLGSDIDISKSLTIEGDTTSDTVIDGSRNTNDNSVGIHRILRVDDATVTIEDLTLTGGDDGVDEALQSCNPCFTLNANGGGAVFDNGSLILDNVAFDNDLAPVGGAVSTSGNSGMLTMTDVAFTGGGGSIGGALFTHGGTVNGDGVTFESNGNGAYDGGAAYLAGGTVTLINTTIVNNGWASSFGGGIDNAGANLTLSNDTFSGNLRGAIETDNGRTTTVARHDHRRWLFRRRRLCLRCCRQGQRRRLHHFSRDHERPRQQHRRGRLVQPDQEHRLLGRRCGPRPDRGQRRSDAHAGAAPRKPGDR